MLDSEFAYFAAKCQSQSPVWTVQLRPFNSSVTRSFLAEIVYVINYEARKGQWANGWNNKSWNGFIYGLVEIVAEIIRVTELQPELLDATVHVNSKYHFQ